METKNLLLERITDLLNAAFHGGAWHGPSVLESVKGLKPKQAAFKTADTHSIAELIYHMTSWRIFVVKKIQGDSEYTISESQNFGHFDQIDEFEVETLLMELSLSHDELLNVLKNKTDDFLNEIVPGAEYTYYTLLHGIIHHDLYHTGQIAILRKIASKSGKSTAYDDDYSPKSSRYFESDDYEDIF